MSGKGRQPVPITVVGSANLDYIVRIPHLPERGETILASSLRKHPGGKGANQAVAAARLGADVRFIGCVGDDDDGTLLLRELRAEGVDTSHVEIVPSEPTGLALVSVYGNGENTIVVVPGANSAVSDARVSRTIRGEAKGAIVVVQAEVQPKVIRATLLAAEEVEARAVMNLAPFCELDEELINLCDPIVLNESEASALVMRSVRGQDAAQEAALEIAQRARSVVVTTGADGACWARQGAGGCMPAPVVSAVVDTTGAGDAFVGQLAAQLAQGADLETAVRYGVQAGSFAVTRDGAQASYAMAYDLPLQSAKSTVADPILDATHQRSGVAP